MTGNFLSQASLRPSLGLVHRLFRIASAGTGPRGHREERKRLCQVVHAGRPRLAEALACARIDIRREPALRSLGGLLPAG
ncbi:hypothetical protein [Streptomyces sp. NPDC004284]|uniref:hypothetical protein n=1 Tax=Streptomyces sp. NPDC004284 TaxID=3364695 RepID=UPI003694E1D6